MKRRTGRRNQNKRDERGRMERQKDDGEGRKRRDVDRQRMAVFVVIAQAFGRCLRFEDITIISRVSIDFSFPHFEVAN